ncbi:hypothetical protein MHK_005089 [Candidatus Magnetomorum sp. HK-1]|nr:hypothetical protein MHK_005089 [Candidatus Magnetomorum sp. HK-1]
MITDDNDFKDDPIQMLLDYQEIIGTIRLLLTELEKIKQFNLSDIFNLTEQMITETIPDISACTLLGQKYGETIINLIDNHYTPFIENTDDTEPFDLSKINSIKEDGMVWNYETNIPTFISSKKSEKRAHLLTWMCELANDLNVYFYCVRDQIEKPFLSHEIDAILIFARIVGSHLSYLYSYQKLFYETVSNVNVE